MADSDRLDRTTTRSNAFTRTLLDITYKEQDELPSSARLPDGRAVMGRMMKLTKKVQKGEKQISANDGSKTVAEELCNKWIEKNVYPSQERNVAKKIKTDYEQFKNLCNQYSSKQFEKKKNQAWYDRVKAFNTSMTKNAHDIRTKSQQWQKKLEDKYGVKMTEEDEAYYIDNCHGNYAATCQPSVSSSWMEKKKRDGQRRQSAEKKTR